MSGLIACKNCRQQKVRCSGRSESGEACERCTRRGLECVVDNSYKRTLKRKAVEVLEAEIDDLKRQLQEANASWRPPAMTTRLPDAHFQPPVISNTSSPVSTVPEVETWTCSPKSSTPESVESLTLDSPTIELLFREYVTHYHRVLPVVEIQHGPEYVYSASAALFWTVMAIASRRLSAELPNGVDFSKLCEVQKQHLSQIAVSPVLVHGKSSEFNLPSLYAVQAFILCTLWPPPTASINADMSWNTIGIAVLTAIRAGLHSPGHAHDFERILKSSKTHRTNMREQLVTWLATNALSQAIANMFGYPSAANFHAHRQYLFHNVELPPRVRHMYEIQRLAHDIEQSLGQLGQGSMRVGLDQTMVTSLIRVHSARYDQIEAEFGAQMDAWTLFTLHAGRAQLFSYYLFGDVDERGAVALYNSCLALLNHVTLQPDEYMKYLPVVSILILWQTSSVVARLYHSKFADNLDKRMGERLYSRVVKKVGLSSVFEHDLPYRAAEIMAQMWGAFGSMRRARPDGAVPLRLALRSRMSASVFFDCLWTMRESSEIRSHAPTKLTKPTTEAPSEMPPPIPHSIPASLRQSMPQPVPRSMQTNSQGMPQALAHSIPQAKSIPNSMSSSMSSSVANSVSSSSSPNQHSLSHLPPPVSPEPQLATPMHSNLHRMDHSGQWRPGPIMPIGAMTSPGSASDQSGATAVGSHKSPVSPVSPAMSALIDPSWTDMDPEAATAIWRDVNSVMEDFGFGLGELPYISP